MFPTAWRHAGAKVFLLVVPIDNRDEDFKRSSLSGKRQSKPDVKY